VGLRLAKGEAGTARVVHPRDGGPHDEPQDTVHEPSPGEHLSSHDAPQETSASDPAHPAGPTAEEGE
jgi:NADH-quinone oxidoreductase subunit E